MEYPKRKQIRLRGFDYSAEGAYFITICIKNNERLLCEIINVGADTIRPILSEYGTIVDKAISSIPIYYKNIRIDKYVIMPTHIHMILTILGENKGGRMVSAPTKTIMTVIGQMKRWVSKELGISIWQKSYYDHIIRDEKDYCTRWNYIEQNPIKWFYNNEKEPDEVNTNDKL